MYQFSRFMKKEQRAKILAIFMVGIMVVVALVAAASLFVS